MMKLSETKLAMIMCNEETCVPEEYTKRSIRKHWTQESKYGVKNQAMVNREG